jgi:thioredoxin 1
MADTLMTFSDQNWQQEVLSSPTPVLVDFWATYCAPCKTLVPVLEAVAAQYAGRLKVGKINVEDNSNVPFQYNITTLPTLLLFKKGLVAEQRIGPMAKDALARLIDSNLT